MFKLCVFFAILAVALAAPAPQPQPKASVGLAYTAPAVVAAPVAYASYVVPSVYSYGHYPYGYSPYAVV